MLNKFYKRCHITKEELNTYTNAIKNYENNISDEDDMLNILIQEAVSFRDNNYQDLYKDIERVIKGETLIQETKDMFEIDTGNNDALAIMNSKASIFDINNINIELKSSKSELIDGSNEKYISLFNRIINENYLTKPSFKFAISDAIKYSRGYPMSITLIGWDDNALLGNDSDFKGDITCENIPISNFYWDNTCNSLETAEYCFIKKLLPYRIVDTFISNLKNNDSFLLKAFYVTKQATAIDNNYDDRVPNQVLINNGAIELITLYKKEIHNNRTIIKVYHIVGDKYVVGRQQYDISYLPFAILKEHSAPNSFTGISSVMLALPYLKQKAFLDGIISTLCLMQKSPIYTYTTSSGVDGSQLINYTGNQSGIAIATNTQLNDTAKLIERPQLTQDILAYRNMLITDIQNVINASDMHNFGSKLSGSAVQSIINQQSISENTSITELERYLVRFISIVLEFLRIKIPKIDKKNISFRAKTNTDTQDINNNGYEIVDIEPKDFEKLKADIYIDASLLRTTKQQKQQQDLMQLYQMQLQYMQDNDTITLKDIVSTLNIPNKQAVIERVENNSQQQKLNQAVGLVQTVMELSQDPELAQMDAQQLTMLAIQAMQQGGK